MGYPADLIHGVSWSGMFVFSGPDLKLACNYVGGVGLGCGDVCIVLLAI